MIRAWMYLLSVSAPWDWFWWIKNQSFDWHTLDTKFLSSQNIDFWYFTSRTGQKKKLFFVSNCLVVWCIKIEMDIYSDYIITTNLTIEPLPVFIFGWKSDSPFSGPWMRLQYQRAHSHKSDIMKIFGPPARKVTFAYMLVIMFNFIENST